MNFAIVYAMPFLLVSKLKLGFGVLDPHPLAVDSSYVFFIPPTKRSSLVTLNVFDSQY
jgi:hypothetical protein